MNASEELSSRTFGNEAGLPRVPLPTLDATAERFMEWCGPLLTGDERARTESALAAFVRPDGPGRRLHAALERYDAAEGVHSWLDTFWPYRYLGRRDRIALNANFFFLFKESVEGQAERAAGLIAGALDFKLRLDEERVPPAVQRGRPLSMVQNRYLFSTTRIPGAEQDTVRAPYTDAWPGPSDARHIVVFFRGNMIRMDVLGPGGRPHTLDELQAGLDTILKAEPAAEPSTGHLTTKARAEWAASRDALLALGNEKALDDVETALFCLCLEDFTPVSTLDACDHLLHGDSGNRWFDKAVSFIVFGDGTAGINVEHCGLDGTTILSFVDELLSASPTELSRRSGAASQGLPAIEPIEFVLDDAMRRDIDGAAASFAAYAAATATTTVSFGDFGADEAKRLKTSPDAFVQMAYQLAHRRAKGLTGTTYESIATRQYRHGRTEAMRVITPEVLDFIAASFAAYAAATATTTVSFGDFGADEAKRLKTSPDAFVQMAYQLAHRRAKGLTGTTYESIATRQYRHGRTEAMRVITPEVLDFVAAMDDPAAGPEARRNAFRAAAEAHVRRARECQAGQAPEQHLWELQLIAKRRGAELGVTEPLPLFDSPGWLKMRDDYLSTSSAPSVNIQYFGFGSTSEQCIGVAYVLLPDRFNVYLSTPQPVAGAMYVFADRLREAVRELRDLLS